MNASGFDAFQPTPNISESNARFQESVLENDNMLRRIRELSALQETAKMNEEQFSKNLALSHQALLRSQDDVKKAKSEMSAKQKQLDDCIQELARLRKSPACVASMEDEYLSYLQEWVVSHHNSIKFGALAVFHGTKPKASQLWTILSGTHQITLPGLLVKSGLKYNLLIVKEKEEDFITSLAASKMSRHLDFADFLLPSPEVGSASPQTAMMMWLEEKGGSGLWSEFAQAFDQHGLKMKDVLKNDEVICIPQLEEDCLLVLVRMADVVFCRFFCQEIKSQGGGAWSSTRFLHFVQHFPGARQIQARVSPAKSNSNNVLTLQGLALKFPSKLWTWKVDDEVFCCLAEERPDVEVDLLERKRKRLELDRQREQEKFELERKIGEEQLKMEREEQKREEWRLQQQHQVHAKPVSSYPPAAAVAVQDAATAINAAAVTSYPRAPTGGGAAAISAPSNLFPPPPSSSSTPVYPPNGFPPTYFPSPYGVHPPPPPSFASQQQQQQHNMYLPSFSLPPAPPTTAYLHPPPPSSSSQSHTQQQQQQQQHAYFSQPPYSGYAPAPSHPASGNHMNHAPQSNHVPRNNNNRSQQPQQPVRRQG